MTIYTSYFDNIANLKDNGFSKFVCIAGYAPSWFKDIDGARTYSLLAPKKIWWQEWHDKQLDNNWYVAKYYETVLSNLDPTEVAKEIGDHSVMLCYEKPDDFCHRHIVANWINMNCRDIQVKEL